ncbi:uncharacterized protein LAJ45_05518 [Morchella importuna]|uniref:uncharacterized protein n=1 Tax=Morchella importuna TaxID=1174673 RepID=UPI001E8D58C0|nr:uncharacterized protein LAJ45_05518 [Morchella importuna]KAH8150307.1 hypothetical protein LAJ45_05518 [Morchella importuna]
MASIAKGRRAKLASNVTSCQGIYAKNVPRWSRLGWSQFEHTKMNNQELGKWKSVNLSPRCFSRFVNSCLIRPRDKKDCPPHENLLLFTGRSSLIWEFGGKITPKVYLPVVKYYYTKDLQSFM